MQVAPAQLAANLKRGLSPVYLVWGDEPLQMRESLDVIRAAARAAGFDERIVFEADGRFDWNRLLAETQTLSLFSSRRILEVRMPSAKPGREGGRFLRDYGADPAPDNLLLLSSGYLDKQTRKGAWYKAVDQAGVTVPVRAIERGRLPGWIQARARGVGLNMAREAADILAERVEGNLLACDQELEKLRLLFGQGDIGLEQVFEAVFDSSRFTLYSLTEAAMAGDPARTVHVFNQLAQEGTAALLFLWVLNADLGVLCRVAWAVEHGERPDQALSRERVWGTRNDAMQKALKRHSPANLTAYLARLAGIDRMVKGQDPGKDPFQALQRLAMDLAGGETVTH